MTEVITYDALREIQYNEKKSEKLWELNDSFYDSIDEYFSRKPKDDLTEIELRNAKNILKDIQDRRERKILSQALIVVRSGMNIDTTAMTGREEELFKNLIDIIKKHRDNTGKKREKGARGCSRVEAQKEKNEPETETPGEEQPEQEENNEPTETTTYIKVKILEELPEIVGSDFETYGPFKKEDIVEIPKENADIFVEKQKAEIIK